MKDFKIRFSIINTIALSVLAVLNLTILIFCFIYTSWGDFQLIHLIGLLIATLMFGGFFLYCLFIITNFTAALVIINEEGIAKKTLMRKQKFYEWNKVISINEQFIRDYLQGGGTGYVFKITKDNKILEIKLFKDQKTTEMIKQLKSNSIVTSSKFNIKSITTFIYN